MASIQKLEEEIEKIKSRNKAVETNKAWETSYTRRIILILLTYLAIGLYLNAIGIEKTWINAIVPAIGFTLSTLTLPFFKSLWEKYIYR